MWTAWYAKYKNSGCLEGPTLRMSLTARSVKMVVLYLPRKSHYAPVSALLACVQVQVERVDVVPKHDFRVGEVILVQPAPEKGPEAPEGGEVVVPGVTEVPLADGMG